MRTASAAKTVVRPVSESLREYGRGVAGGLIFSLPLLYTMEMWFAGITARPWSLVLYAVVTFILLLGYNRYAGMRHDSDWTEVAIDSVEEMGIGLVLSALALLLLGRITMAMPAHEMVGPIVVEAMTVAIGVSVGTAQLGSSNEREEGMGESGTSKDESRLGGQLAIAFCGAILFAANVGPTDEIPVLAGEMSRWKLIALAGITIVIATVIVTHSGFRGSDQNPLVKGRWSILFVGLITYAVAICASAMILLFFGRFDGASVGMVVSQVVVLSAASALGASAGRLLLQ